MGTSLGHSLCVPFGCTAGLATACQGKALRGRLSGCIKGPCLKGGAWLLARGSFPAEVDLRCCGLLRRQLCAANCDALQALLVSHQGVLELQALSSREK